ncbi:hypothetical protein MRY82_07385 [bacterium]|nr:hypothetical protein [bacterium]
MYRIKQFIVKISIVLGVVLSVEGVFANNSDYQTFYGTTEVESGSVDVQLFHLGQRYVNLRSHSWVKRHFWTLEASVFGYVLECEDLQTWHYFNTVIDRNVAQRYIYCVNQNSPYGIRVRFDHDFDFLSPHRSYGELKSNLGYAEVYEKSSTDTKSGNYRNPNKRLFDRFTMNDEHCLVKINLRKDVSELKD